MVFCVGILPTSAEVCLSDVRSEGKRYLHVISDDRAAKLPEYEPSKVDPQIPPRQACQIAEKYLKAKYAKIAGFNVDSISIQYASTASPHVWYYYIQFVPSGSPEWALKLDHAVVVLLDGSVVDVVVSKDDGKSGL
jgi:hypothetical protein